MSKSNNQDDKIILLAYKVGRVVSRDPGFSHGDTFELTMLQLRTLTILSEGSLTMGDIATELQIKLPTASLLISRLFDLGMVKRVADKIDRRKVYIKVTPKGKKALDTTLEAKMKRMRLVLKEISKQDKDALCEILNRVYLKISKEGKK